ncbi:MAG TPA: ribonuclease domain-containing protein [Alphaproteobacteria bacterium]|nr:ribonuclease domain-containing protein [Alphaproteobacteria bacterium]
MFRRFAIAALALIGIAVGLGWSAGTFSFSDDPQLIDFATRIGLQDPGGFAETVTSLRHTGRLPARYVAKDAAQEFGWRPGADLCRVLPSHVIGGDRFANREGRLPDRHGRVWGEADLDFACGRRGPRRLVFSNDGLMFVTLDHYETFIEVPR